MALTIQLGKALGDLLKLRKNSKTWDPEGQMPWEKKMRVSDGKKKYDVTITLNPKEINYAEKDPGDAAESD
jgi:hypothetical protein